MRSLSLLLILANVLYFSWAQFIDVNFDAASVENASTARPRTIRLAAEVSSPPDSPVEPFTPLRATDCVSVGPFLSLSEATRAAATLSAAGFESQQRIEQGTVWAGYWVFIPNVENTRAADATLRLLKDNGIEDVFVVPGPEGAVLSLGIFVDAARAYRRAQSARGLGLIVRTQERRRPGSLYWIDATPQQVGSPLDPSMFPPEPGKIVRIELRPCPNVDHASAG